MKRIWKCKDGTKIKVKNMTMEHILNSLRVLKRHHNQLFEQAIYNLNELRGEMAIATLDTRIDFMEEEDCYCKTCEWIETFNREIEIRNKNDA